MWTLTQEELRFLERLLCNLEESSSVADQTSTPISTRVSKASPDTQTSNSLFNNISNISDSTSSRSELQETFDLRASLLNVLAPGTSPQTSRPIGTEPEPQVDIDPDNQGHTISESQSGAPVSTVIINDSVSGIARLIISDPSTSEPTSRSVDQQLTGDSGEFVFTLPHATVQGSESGSTTDVVINGSTASSNNVTINSSDSPTRVTVNRSLSNGNDQQNLVKVQRRHSSDSDSSSTISLFSLTYSDSDSDSMSGEEGGDGEMGGRRQLVAQAFLQENSEHLKQRHKTTGELIRKLFICISGIQIKQTAY